MEVHLPQSGVTCELIEVQNGRVMGPNVLVILFGFMGANYRQLLRYVKLYLELHKGCSSVTVFSVIAPIQFTMTALVTPDSKKNGYGVLAQDLLSFLALNERYAESKVILHVMSQNGTFAYQALHNERELMKRVVCIVFDSAPVAMTYDAIFRAASAAIGAGIAKKAIDLLKWVCTEHQDFESYLASRTADVKEFFSRENWCASTLFLYSRSDLITTSSYVEEIIAGCERRGVEGRVLGVDFGESGHTGHILKYPDRYRTEVLQFCCHVLKIEVESVLSPTARL